MKFEDRATFEVPIDGWRVGPPLDKAAAHMRAALDKLQLRQWDDALTKCREVLTELQQFLPAPPPGWGDWADKTKREGWNLIERVAAAQAAVRHLTHAGPHAAIGAPDEREVRLVVTMTGALCGTTRAAEAGAAVLRNATPETVTFELGLARVRAIVAPMVRRFAGQGYVPGGSHRTSIVRFPLPDLIVSLPRFRPPRGEDWLQNTGVVADKAPATQLISTVSA